MEEFDWKNIKGFYYRFVGERKSYADQRNRLNNKYGYFCPAPDDMFITGDDGSRQLIADPIVFLRKQLAQDIMMDLNIIDNAKRTEVEDHIAVLLAGVTFNGITNNGARFRLRNSQGMNNIGEKTHAEGHKDFILEIDIDHWIFRRTWNSKRFDKIYLEDHEQPSDSEDDDSKSTTSAPTQGGNSAVDDRLAKILEEQQKLIAELAQQRTPTATQANNSGQQLPISDDHWNSRELPDPVRKRFDLRDTYLPKEQMGTFEIENKDENGVVVSTAKVNHYLHTKRGSNIQKLITRSGDCYDLTPQDDNKKSFEKQFLAKFPKLRAEEPAEVRRWYRAIVGRAKEFHLYVHPYYNFRREVNHNRGFTVGDDFPDDVPKRYETAIDEWGTLLHMAMCQDKIIPDSCGKMKATVINFEEGKGYEALWGVVRSTHPNNLPSYETNKLIRSYRQQREDEEFEHYYFRFHDHLQMKAYLTHPCSLDDPQEISALIGGCINHVELKKLTAQAL